MFSRAVGKLGSSAERGVLARIVKKPGAILDYLTCRWVVLNAQSFGCAVSPDRGRQWMLEHMCHASQLADGSCASDATGTAKRWTSPRANGARALVALSVLYKPRCPRFPKESQDMEEMKYQGELYSPLTLHPWRSPQRPLNQVHIPHNPWGKKIQSIWKNFPLQRSRNASDLIMGEVLYWIAAHIALI